MLPATTTLERDDLTSRGGVGLILALHTSVEPVEVARNDFAIFRELADRLGIADAFDEGRDEAGWIRHLYDLAHDLSAKNGVELPDFDTFWEQGYVELPPPAKPFVLFEDFQNDPEANPLQTPSGKVEIFSETIALDTPCSKSRPSGLAARWHHGSRCT